MRREGLYSSHIVDWRRPRDSGTLAGAARPRGRPAADPRNAQIARLRKEKAKLEQELAKARFVVDVQSKLQALAAGPFLRGQPAAIGLPHASGIPHNAPTVSRACNLRR